MKSEPRFRCGNCGYPFFTGEVDSIVLCLRCHTANVVEEKVQTNLKVVHMSG